jgi:hypothetical protein
VNASAVIAILDDEDLAEDLMARIAERGGPFYVLPHQNEILTADAAETKSDCGGDQ